ncbi:HlyD family efflux transporter periplasmic adaptor subunit [bacterium]|nr:HlyD family efflux transporter periplasmic adaptor subunit [bacterium]
MQSLLEQPPASLPQGMILGGLTFIAIAGTWSWFGTLEEVSFAPGHLAPKGDVYKVQAPTSGEVTSLWVNAGDPVTQGQVIAELDHQQVEKEIERLNLSLNANRQKLAQTQTLIAQTQLELNTQKSMAMANIAAHKAAIEQEKTAMVTSGQMLDQLRLDRQAQTERMTRLQELVQRGAVAEDQLFQVEQALRDRDRSITETQGMTDRSTATITQLEAELLQSQAMAQKNELDGAKQLQQLQMEATQLASSIKETQAMLEQTQAELTQTILKASVSGIVSGLEIANTGEVMQPGQTLAEISPSTAPLVLSALLPSREAGLVEVGMPVNIKFDAFPYQDYGMVTGQVLSISPNAKVDEKMGAVYQVDVALDTTHMNHEGEAIALQAGQTAMAEITVRQRRIISLILEPFRKLRKSNISL